MSSLQVTFVAADRTVFSGEAAHVSVTTIDGSMGILPRMAPQLAVLAAGPVEIKSLDGSKNALHVSGGFVSVDDSNVTVVADDATDTVQAVA